MDFIAKLREAWEFTWKYKSLWVLGFIMALFGGGAGNNYNSFNSRIDSSSNSDYTDSLDKLTAGLTDNALAVILILGLTVLVLIIALIGWYLVNRARASLIVAIKTDAKGDKPSLKSAWQEGGKYVWRLLGMDVLSFLMVLVVILPIILLFVIGSLAEALLIGCLILGCILLPVFIIAAIVWAMTYTAAQRLLVLENIGAWESIKRGFGLAKKRYMDFFLGFLVFILPSCGWQILSCLILFIPMLGGALIVIAAILSGNIWLVIAVVTPIIILFVLFTAMINAPFTTFGYTYWTKIVMELTTASGTSKN